MSNQANTSEAGFDCDLRPPCLVGTEAHDRGDVELTVRAFSAHSEYRSAAR